MKTKLLLLSLLFTFSVHAQTTHDINWQRNVTGTGTADLTIEVGDTVRWTWIDSNHTVENVVGSSMETFSSGFLGPVGSTFEHTFTVIGINDYFCGVHGAGSMAGTITVDPTASIEDQTLQSFEIYPNPASTLITIKLPANTNAGIIEVYNIVGKHVQSKSLDITTDNLLDISNLQSGLYIIRITSGDSSQTKRFIKL